MMKYKIKAFGIVKEIVGGKEVVVELQDDIKVADLLMAMQAKYPGLRQLNALFVAVNREYADNGKVVTEKDEIALIPPVSGG